MFEENENLVLDGTENVEETTEEITGTETEPTIEKPVEEVKESEIEPVVEVNTDELMTMDHKVELATYMKEKGLDPKLTIVEAAKSLGTDVPLLKESDFEKVKEYIDNK